MRPFYPLRLLCARKLRHACRARPDPRPPHPPTRPHSLSLGQRTPERAPAAVIRFWSLCCVRQWISRHNSVGAINILPNDPGKGLPVAVTWPLTCALLTSSQVVSSSHCEVDIWFWIWQRVRKLRRNHYPSTVHPRRVVCKIVTFLFPGVPTMVG